MKIIMYGAEICPDCVFAKAKMEEASEIELNYKDITADTKTLKEFLAYRDNDEVFKKIVKDGKIGIPFFILENGTKTFDIQDFLDVEKPVQSLNICSFDGEGNC